MKQKDKGFTLAELLIVVAIIAVLIAIAIPVFNSQLEKARIATNEANIRSAYTRARMAIMTDTYEPDVLYVERLSGKTKMVTVLNVPLKKTKTPISEYDIEWPDGAESLNTISADGLYKVTFAYYNTNLQPVDEMIHLEQIGIVPME